MLTFWVCPTSWVPSPEWCICGPSPSTSRSRGSGQCWGAAGTSAFPPPRWNAAAPPWSAYGSAEKHHTRDSVFNTAWNVFSEWRQTGTTSVIQSFKVIHKDGLKHLLNLIQPVGVHVIHLISDQFCPDRYWSTFFPDILLTSLPGKSPLFFKEGKPSVNTTPDWSEMLKKSLCWIEIHHKCCICWDFSFQYILHYNLQSLCFKMIPGKNHLKVWQEGTFANPGLLARCHKRETSAGLRAGQGLDLIT